MAGLSVWIGDLGWGHFISSGVFRIDTASWAVIKNAPISAYEAEDMTNLLIWLRVITEPFHRDMELFSERKI